MIKREAVTNNIVDDLNSRNENWDKLETMSNQLETEYEPRLDTAETNINDLLPKVDLATVDTQIGTFVQSKIADDYFVELTIEGATTVTPTNPDLDISPDNVATITSAKDFDVVACGKNLFDYNKFYDNYFTIEGSNVGRYTLRLKPNTDYIAKVNFNTSNNSAIAFILNTPDELSSTGLNGVIPPTPRKFKTGEDGIIYVGIYVSGRWAIQKEDFDSGSKWLEIEQGSTTTPYEPYKSNKLTITKELNKLPNGVTDTRERIDDKYVKYTQRIRKTTRTTTGSIVDAKTNGQYICSVAPSGFLNGTTFTMPSGATSAEVLYELAEPIETIVEESSTLISYKGITNVFTTAMAQPKLTATFKSRLKNTTEILLAEIAKLKQAIISLGGTI